MHNWCWILSGYDGVRCVNVTLVSFSNLGLLGEEASHWSEQPWWPQFNVSDPSSVSIGEYQEWFSHYGSLAGPNITDCDLDKEMNKVILKSSGCSLLKVRTTKLEQILTKKFIVEFISILCITVAVHLTIQLSNIIFLLL